MAVSGQHDLKLGESVRIKRGFMATVRLLYAGMPNEKTFSVVVTKTAGHIARISQSPPATSSYLNPSPALVLIADLDVFKYAFAQLTAPCTGSVATYEASRRRL